MDGSRVDFRLDPWITIISLNAWQTYINMDFNLRHKKVINFIILEKTWKVDILATLFPADILYLILAVPIAHGCWCDQLAWGAIYIWQALVSMADFYTPLNQATFPDNLSLSPVSGAYKFHYELNSHVSIFQGKGFNANFFSLLREF